MRLFGKKRKEAIKNTPLVPVKAMVKEIEIPIEVEAALGELKNSQAFSEMISYVQTVIESQMLLNVETAKALKMVGEEVTNLQKQVKLLASNQKKLVDRMELKDFFHK